MPNIKFAVAVACVSRMNLGRFRPDGSGAPFRQGFKASHWLRRSFSESAAAAEASMAGLRMAGRAGRAQATVSGAVAAGIGVTTQHQRHRNDDSHHTLHDCQETVRHC